MVAFLYAQCKEGAGECVNIVAELGVGTGIVELSIAESILVRELLTDTVEDIGEGVVDYLLLRPRILTVAAHIGLERVLVLLLVGSHILSELRDNDTCIAEVLSPALYPFE